VQSAVVTVRAAGKETFYMRAQARYQAGLDGGEDWRAPLLNGEITPEAFCEEVEQLAEKIRNDRRIQKYKR